MKKFLFLFLILLFVSVSGGEFRIVATADLHGNMRNLAALAPVIKKENPDLLADCGDLTGGNILAELDGGSSMIRALNLLKFQCRIPGNHDFDTEYHSFSNQCAQFKGVTLGADWRWKNVHGVSFTVINKNGFKTAVIGLTEPRLQRRHLKVPGAPQFARDWNVVLPQVLGELRKENPHFTVLLWHRGAEELGPRDFHSPAFYPEINLVIGAHTHREDRGRNFPGSYFVQPGAYGRSAALVKVIYDDKSFKVKNIESGLLRGDYSKPDPGVTALSKSSVKPYYPRIYKKICRRGDLEPERFPRLGAQAICRAARSQGAVFAVTFPANRFKGGMLYKDLFQLLPYRNTLCVAALDKRELKEFLEDLHLNNARFKRTVGVYGFSWQPGKEVRSEHFKNGGRIQVAVSSYLMTSSPVLKKIMNTTSRWREVDIVERDAVQKFLEEGMEKFKP